MMLIIECLNPIDTYWHVAWDELYKSVLNYIYKAPPLSIYMGSNFAALHGQW